MSALAKALEGMPVKTTADFQKPEFYNSQRNDRLYVDRGQTKEQRFYLQKAYEALDKVKSEEDIKSLFDPDSDFHELNSQARAYAQRIFYDAMKASGGTGLIKGDVNAFREKHKNDTVEYYYEMDADGNIVTAIMGASNTVNMHNYGESSMNDGFGGGKPPRSEPIVGGSSWHNHPKATTPSGFGFPPSVPDLTLALATKSKTQFVEADEGRYKFDFSGYKNESSSKNLDVVFNYQSVWHAWMGKLLAHREQSKTLSYKDLASTRPSAAALVDKIVSSLSDSLAGTGIKLTFEPSPSYNEALKEWKSKPNG